MLRRIRPARPRPPRCITQWQSLVFVLPTNLGLAMILMAAVIFFPFMLNPVTGLNELLLPMAPTQLLWINLVATVALAAQFGRTCLAGLRHHANLRRGHPPP